MDMKKETSFLKKLKLALALSTLFFIISMIPFALANKEEVTDSYNSLSIEFYFFHNASSCREIYRKWNKILSQIFYKLVCFKFYYPFRVKIIFHIDKLLSVIL